VTPMRHLLGPADLRDELVDGPEADLGDLRGELIEREPMTVARAGRAVRDAAPSRVPHEQLDGALVDGYLFLRS